MAVGDKVGGLVTVLASGNADSIMRPPTGQEWTIHNIYYSGTITWAKTDGTLSVDVESDSAGGRIGAVFNVTNDHWISIVNTGGSSIVVGFDGVQTK
jgi:hypothetical protein